MYKLKPKYKGQDVVVFTPDKKAIQLETANQEELKIAFKIKGNEKFISYSKKDEAQANKNK